MKMVRKKKQFFTGATILLVTGVFLFTIFITHRALPQKASAQSTTQTTLFFSQDGCTNSISALSLSTGTPKTLSVCLDSGNDSINGFDITANLSSLLNYASIQSPTDGTSTAVFTLVTNTFTNGVLHYIKVDSRLTGTAVSGHHLDLIDMVVTPNSPGTGSVNINSNALLTTDPSLSTGTLTVSVPTLSYTITASVTPTVTLIPSPTGRPQTADADNNGCIGRNDYIVWRNAYKSGITPQGKFPDMNLDGYVDQKDYNFWFNAMLSSNNICSGG